MLRLAQWTTTASSPTITLRLQGVLRRSRVKPLPGGCDLLGGNGNHRRLTTSRRFFGDAEALYSYDAFRCRL